MPFSRFLFLLLLLSTGCARTAVVKFWKPAGTDVSDLDRIAVMEFNGNSGDSVASSLAGQLWDNDFFTVVEPSKFQPPVQMASFVGSEESAFPPLDLVLTNARSQGIDGVVIGEVLEYHCEDRQIRRTPFRPGLEPTTVENSEGKRLDPRDAVIREGRVTVSFRLVDAESGEIRAEQKFTHEFQQLVDKGSQIPTQGEVLEQLTQRCLQDIVDCLTPHEATTKVKLAQSDPLSRSRREAREGMQLAHAGKWDQAEAKWQSALEKDPDNHAVLFNLAMVADHRRDYARAEELAMQAMRLQYKDLYAEGLEQIRARKSAANKVNEQRESQLTKFFADGWR